MYYRLEVIGLAVEFKGYTEDGKVLQKEMPDKLVEKFIRAVAEANGLKVVENEPEEDPAA